MKKSNVYFIYGLLFAIMANVVDNRLMAGLAGLAAICAILYVIASLVLYYFEDKYN